jgi:hypothetical protein
MSKKFLITLGGLILLLPLWVSSLALAQNSTAVPAVPTARATTASVQATARPTVVGTPTTNVNYFFVVCDNRAVLDLDGIIGRNLDVYVQVFRSFSATGNAITSEVRIQLDGSFQSSTILQYNTNETLLLGQPGSAKLKIANETTGKVTFETTVDDIQDGCAEPQFTSTTINGTTATGGTAPISGTAVLDPITKITRIVVGDSGVYKPDGSMLNLVFATPKEEIVQIGVRPSEVQDIEGRTSDPGLIFAECGPYPKTHPGRLFDSDNLTVYWSWFAKTPEQVQDHINNAVYDIQINGQSLTKVSVSAIKQLGDGNYWVFYTANMGDSWQPGNYELGFHLFWNNAISDGYDSYGPGTATERIESICNYKVEANPFGKSIGYKNPVVPIAQP